VTAFAALAIETGVRLEWPKASGDQYYRLFRAASPEAGARAISVTDFAITATNYVDVNVKPSTTYYYTFAQVLADADPWNDIPEQLGPISKAVSVTTSDSILSPEGKGEKHFILMKLNDPEMNADGITKEIDPGRGTSPITRSGRTVLPIRALIEEIGGVVGWEDETSKITLSTGGNNVVMWLDKTDLVINGRNDEMDVAPVSINGRTMVPVRFAAESSGCKVEWLSRTEEIVVVYYLPEDAAPFPPETKS
jgi:hypothetical protein